MSNLPTAEVERPEPPPRLTPKLSLRGMVAYVMELRARCRFKGGPNEGLFADRAYVELTPEDMEKLDDVAEALDWLYMQQVKSQSGGRRR